jgi:hypothetical protein
VLGMRGYAGTPTDEKALLSHKTRRHAVEREELGLAVWQPLRVRDEDLVPLAAGACSPHPGSSRRIPRQTSGPDPNPYEGRGAASRRPRAGHPSLAQHYCQTADPLASWVKQRSATYASVASRHARRRARPPSLVRAVDPPIEPSSNWHHCHRVAVNAQEASRVRQVAGVYVSRKADGVGGAQRLWPRSTSAPWVARIAQSGWAGWFVAAMAGYPATVRQQAGLM